MHLTRHHDKSSVYANASPYYDVCQASAAEHPDGHLAGGKYGL